MYIGSEAYRKHLAHRAEIADDELRQQQESQSDHDALHRFENEGGAVDLRRVHMLEQQLLADREVREQYDKPTMVELCDFFENVHSPETVRDRVKAICTELHGTYDNILNRKTADAEPHVSVTASYMADISLVPDTQVPTPEIVRKMLDQVKQALPETFFGMDYGFEPGYAVVQESYIPSVRQLSPEEVVALGPLPEMPPDRILPALPAEEGTAAAYLESQGVFPRNLAALELTAEQAAAIYDEAKLQRKAEAESLAAELDADPLSRAYRKVKTAKTSKQKKAARSAVRRATRHKLVRTMRQNNDSFKADPNLARTIAAQIVRATMSTHDDE